MEVPQKLKVELPYDPASPPLGMYLKEAKRLTQKHLYPHVYSALFTTAKIRRQ